MPTDQHAAIVSLHLAGACDSSMWHVASSKLHLFDLVAEDILGSFEALLEDRWEEISLNADGILETLEDDRAQQDSHDFSPSELMPILSKLLRTHRADLEAGRADTIWSGLWSDVVRDVSEAGSPGGSHLAIVAEGSLESVLRQVFEWERAPPAGWDGSPSAFRLQWLGEASVLLGIEDWSRCEHALRWALRLVDEWNVAHEP